MKPFVPKNVAAKVPPDKPACPRNGHDVFRALSPCKGIVMASTIRNPSVIPGIMRVSAELSAVVATERFRQEVAEVPAGYSREIEYAAHREELSLLRAFRAEETARIVADTLTTSV